MGTRSLTVFVDVWEDPDTKEIHEKELVVMYRQFDGYPTGHGAELKEYLQDMGIVNGLSCGQPEKKANGMGCLAALTIANFKGTNPGGFYIEAAGARDCGEEYIYVLRPKDGKVHLQVYAGCITMFGLPGTKQENMGLAYDGMIQDFDPEKVEEISRDIRQTAPNDFLDSQKKKEETLKGVKVKGKKVSVKQYKRKKGKKNERVRA